MTSGEFHSIPVDEIRVDRDVRQRQKITEIDGIEGLAESIKRLGLIHPIVVTRDLTLVSGERRLTAVKSLGWPNILCQYTDELEPSVRRLIELEENIKRVNVTWQEQRAAVAEIHGMMVAESEAKGEKWNQEQTGERFGLKQNTVSTYQTISEEIDRGDAKNNARILGATTLASAYDIVQSIKERRFQALSNLGTKKSEIIVHADFCDWVKTYDGPRFNFIHCDFPYGKDTEKRQQGTAVAVHGGYDDSPETYRHLLKVLCANLPKLCTDSAHIMFWFHPSNYAETLAYFSDYSDFEFDEVPLVWVKSDKRGLVPDWQRRPRRIYETCLFGWRGDRKIIKLTENACWLPLGQSPQHLSPKAVPVLRQSCSIRLAAAERPCVRRSHWAQRISWASRLIRNTWTAPLLHSETQGERNQTNRPTLHQAACLCPNKESRVPSLYCSSPARTRPGLERVCTSPTFGPFGLCNPNCNPDFEKSIQRNQFCESPLNPCGVCLVVRECLFGRSTRCAPTTRGPGPLCLLDRDEYRQTDGAIAR